MPTGTANTALYSMFDGIFHHDLALDHQRRLQAYRHFWLFYLSKHWSYVRDPGEPTITINYCRRLLDVLNDFTFKKGFKVVIPDDPSTKIDESEDREFVRHMVEETWRRNKKELWMLEASQQGGVTGDVFARVSWEKNDPLEDPYAKVDIIPSHLVFPETGGPLGVDRKRLTRLIILNPVFEDVKGREIPSQGMFSPHPAFSISGATPGNKELAIYGEEWKAAEYDRKTGEQTKPAVVRYYRNKEFIEEKPNPLGEIPVVHIPNYPLSGEYFGISDLVDAAEINRELNEKITDISDIINYHGSPVTIVSGAKLKDLERGANRVWGLPSGADAKNLELIGDLGAAVQHWETLKIAMMELMGVPEQAMGKFQGLSNVSGVALAIQYLPLMEKRGIKVLTYGLGLRLINRLIMKVTEIADPKFGAKLEKLQGNRYRNDVVFPNPMPQDEAAELEKARARLDLGLSTRRKELEAMGKSQAESEAIISDSLREMREATEAEFDLDLSGRGQNQNMRGGDPGVRGPKVSATATQQAFETPLGGNPASEFAEEDEL